MSSVLAVLLFIAFRLDSPVLKTEAQAATKGKALRTRAEAFQLSGHQASKYWSQPKNINTSFWKTKDPNDAAGAGKGKTQRLMLGLKRGICAPSQSSAEPTGDMQHQKRNRLQEEASANHLLRTHRSPPGAFLSQDHYCAHYHQIMGRMGLYRKAAKQTFSQLISELILSSASILYSQQCSLLQSNAMHTPLKNDAFKPALWCSKFESALNNNKDQHWL